MPISATNDTVSIGIMGEKSFFDVLVMISVSKLRHHHQSKIN